MTGPTVLFQRIALKEQKNKEKMLQLVFPIVIELNEIIPTMRNDDDFMHAYLLHM